MKFEQAQEKNYTLPLFIPKKSLKADWYVSFDYIHDGVKHPLKIRKGINRGKTIKERTEFGKALAAARLAWLEAGWNPITDPKFRLRNSPKPESSDEVKKMLLPDAFEWALKKMKGAEKTIAGYSSQVSLLIASMRNNGYDYLPVTEFSTFHVLTLMEQIEKDRNLSDHGYNKYKSMICRCCRQLKIWQIIPSNPALDLPTRRLPESDKYAPWTHEEKIRISEYLVKNHWRFFVHVMTIYHAGLRPKESLALQIRDIDFENREIKIVPDAERDNSKTLNIRKVPIDDHLYFWLKELRLEKYPKHYYVFGSPFASGVGNRGSMKWPCGTVNVKSGISGAERPDYFKPSDTRIKRDTVTKLWKRLIMDDNTGLGIKKHLYAGKHTGGDDKILAGVDLDALRALYGHKNKRMSELYAKAIKGRYKREIIKKTQAFTDEIKVED